MPSVLRIFQTHSSINSYNDQANPRSRHPDRASATSTASAENNVTLQEPQKCSVAVVQSLSCVRLSATPWTAARQAFLSFTISWSLCKLMSTESLMPSNHLILCRPLLVLPSSFPASGSFQMSHSSHQVTKVLEFQLSIVLSLNIQD